MDEKAKRKEERVEEAQPLAGCAELVLRLHGEARAGRWGLNAEKFSNALERSVRKRMSGAELSVAQREEFLSTLHLEDLALAQACAMGFEPAWEFFVETYRPYLRTAAAAILRASSASAEVCELSDSLFAELYGLADGKTGERSLFRYFHGRSSLRTWLRALMAQRHIDAVRVARRFESLDEPDGEGKVHEPAGQVVLPIGDPHKEKYIRFFQMALAEALGQIELRDGERLKLYYVEEKTLAEIGKKLGEHESSVSRKLERIRREIRENVEEILRKPAPWPTWSDAQIALCFEYAAEDAPIDLGKLMKSQEPKSLQKGKHEA